MRKLNLPPPMERKKSKKMSQRNGKTFNLEDIPFFRSARQTKFDKDIINDVYLQTQPLATATYNVVSNASSDLWTYGPVGLRKWSRILKQAMLDLNETQYKTIRSMTNPDIYEFRVQEDIEQRSVNSASNYSESYSDSEVSSTVSSYEPYDDGFVSKRLIRQYFSVYRRTIKRARLEIAKRLKNYKLFRKIGNRLLFTEQGDTIDRTNRDIVSKFVVRARHLLNEKNANVKSKINDFLSYREFHRNYTRTNTPYVSLI